MSEHRRGRQTIDPEGEHMKPRGIRMTNAEWKECRALGGSAWVRACVHASKPVKQVPARIRVRVVPST